MPVLLKAIVFLAHALFAPAFLGICLWLVWPHLASIDLTDVFRGLGRIHWWQWGLALASTLISFAAMAKFDVMAHRQLGTSVETMQARRTGVVASALGQFVGFGAITGAFARWRRSADKDTRSAVLITGFVSLTFLSGLLVWVALICMVLPVHETLRQASSLALGLLIGASILALLHPRLQFGRHSFDLPGLPVMSAAFLWAGVSVFAAAFAFCVLLPQTSYPSLSILLPWVTLAVAAGRYCGTPGGIGPFEITVLAFLTTSTPATWEPASGVSAMVGFRLVYWFLPGVAAVLALLHKPKPASRWKDTPAPSVARAPRAETSMLRQKPGGVAALGKSHAALWRTGQTLTALFDPMGKPDAAFFRDLGLKARDANRLPLLHKCSARTASAARTARWQVMHIADEALIPLKSYHLHSPQRAGLRRRLVKAQTAGVTVRRAQLRDHSELARVDAAWRRRYALSTSGSFGRFQSGYILEQAVFVALHRGAVVGFVSFHRNPREWTLDLVRHTVEAPEGTVHALVHRGISQAREALVGHVSLSSVTACPNPAKPHWRALTRLAIALNGSALRREFRTQFVPVWQPLYTAAPSRLALAIGLADMAREGFMPDPMPHSPPRIMHKPHNHDEDYDLASSSAA